MGETSAVRSQSAGKDRELTGELVGPVHPSTPQQGVAGRRKESLTTLTELQELFKEVATGVWISVVRGQVPCFGKCRGEVGTLASDFGLEKVVAAVSVVCGCQ